MSAPLFGFAAHIWCLGSKVIRAQQFPPPRYHVAPRTPVVQERRALTRGRSFKILAGLLATVAAVMWCLLWRLASALTERAASPCARSPGRLRVPLWRRLRRHRQPSGWTLLDIRISTHRIPGSSTNTPAAARRAAYTQPGARRRKPDTDKRTLATRRATPRLRPRTPGAQ